MNKKKLSLFLNLILGLVFISSASTQNNKETAQSVNQENMFTKAQYYCDVADNYLRYLNEKNLEGILSLYADTATVEDPVGSTVLKGKEALRKFYSGAVTIDLTLKRIGQVRVAEVEISFPFQLIMDYNGTSMITDIIDVFRFDEAGRIISMRAFWGSTNCKPVTK